MTQVFVVIRTQRLCLFLVAKEGHKEVHNSSMIIFVMLMYYFGGYSFVGSVRLGGRQLCRNSSSNAKPSVLQDWRTLVCV